MANDKEGELGAAEVRKQDKGQRNFLGDYETMLKAVQFDYACCGRFDASGYSDFIGQLYTMNPRMFQNASYCDRTLTQMALHFLRWFQDPNLRLVVGPGAQWHVSWGSKTQRVGDELYVTEILGEAPVSVGERIVKVNGMTLDKVYPEIERTLCTTVEPSDPEREDWSVVLAFANHLTVRSADDEERTVKTVILKDLGKWLDSTDHRPACTLESSGDVAVLKLRNMGSADAEQELAEVLPAARTARRLVIDVRGAEGGTQEDIYPLVELVLGPQDSWTPEQLFGPRGILLNCSRHNIDAKLGELNSLRAKVVREAEADQKARAAQEAQEAQAEQEVGDVGARSEGLQEGEGLQEQAGAAVAVDAQPEPAPEDVWQAASTPEEAAASAETAAAPASVATPTEAASQVVAQTSAPQESLEGIAAEVSAAAEEPAEAPAAVLAAEAPVSAAASEQAVPSAPAPDLGFSLEFTEELAEIDAYAEELRGKRGVGFVHEMTQDEDFYPDLVFAAADDAPEGRRVVVLVDRWTSDAAEWLVRAARSAGFAQVAGRATKGSIDTTCPRAVRLDEDFTLVVPTATYLAAHEGMATLGRGIVPDVHLAWTPEQIERDVELEQACKLARG